jgi:hypothetical protein
LEYQNFLCDLLGATRETRLVTDENGEIQGVLPLLSIEGTYGKVYNSMPFFGSNGGVTADSSEAAFALVREYNHLASAAGVAASTWVANPLNMVQFPGVVHNLSDYRIGQLTPIKFQAKHADSLMGTFHFKTRNMIRKAQKLGICVKQSNDQIEFLADTHGENLELLGGIRKPRRFFELFPNYFAPGTTFKIYTAEFEGKLVAALLLFYFNKCVEYFMPVIRHEFRNTQAMSAIIFQAMLDASLDGYSWWNWGGTWPTEQDGVARFKSRWGTENRQYAYYVQLNDQGIRRLRKDRILEAYPNFYVLPFSSLVDRPKGAC